MEWAIKNNMWRISIIFSLILCLVSGSGLSGKAYADNWDAALSSLDRLHDSYTALETVVKLEKDQTTILHKKNASDLSTLNEKIKAIDKTRNDGLKADTDHAAKKYAPLLSEYTDLGKKATAARKSHNLKDADLYDLKRNKLKPSVDAAKLEIKHKRDASSAALKQTAAKVKLVKDALQPVQVLKQQITAENKVITATNSRKVAAEKLYRSAIKQGNAVTASAEMAIMYAELGKVHASQQKIKGWEDSIARAQATAKSKLPI